MILYLYRIVLWFFAPMVLLRLLFKASQEPAYGKRVAERFGHSPEHLETGGIWFHTVSAGETIAAAPVVAKILAEDLGLPVMVTTMTPSGSEMVKKIFEDRVGHCYLPYDYKFSVSRFFDRTDPKILVLMETELWPNLINEAWARLIPVVCINARLSEKSAKGYRLVSPLTKRLLSQIDFIACQSEVHARRFQELGSERAKVEAYGNIKFDLVTPSDLLTRSSHEREKFQLSGRHVWIAASTHEGEELIVMNVFTRLRETHPNLCLIVVPRHPSRAPKIVTQFQSEGFKVVAESMGIELISRSHFDVLIGDVMGRLFDLYGMADVAMVGGSFVKVGGHNPIEPAVYGIPIIVGPEQYNFAEVMADFERLGGLRTAFDSQDLYKILNSLLLSERQRREMGAAALETVNENRGATEKLVEMLKKRILALIA